MVDQNLHTGQLEGMLILFVIAGFFGAALAAEWVGQKLRLSTGLSHAMALAACAPGGWAALHLFQWITTLLSGVVWR